MSILIVVLFSLLGSILQCHCYGPQVVNGYWWLDKQSPFRVVAAVPGQQNEINPFFNPFVRRNSCNGHDCVDKIPCVDGFTCVPQNLCQNGVIGKNQLSQIGASSKFCATSKEVCCKISYQYEGNQGYEQKPGCRQCNEYSNPEYASSNSYVQRMAPYYTGDQNTTPYPGCGASLKCVPEEYCSWEGVVSDRPAYLSGQSTQTRVTLSKCVLSDWTGQVGRCCRESGYKYAWPNHNSNYNHGNYNGYDDSRRYKRQTEASQTQHTIKKLMVDAKPNQVPLSTHSKLVLMK